LIQTSLIDAVELDLHAFARHRRRQAEMLAIPADAGGQVSARSTARLVLAIWSGDAPVMGEVDGAPRAILEVWQLRAGQIAFRELPAIVEVGPPRKRIFGSGDGRTIQLELRDDSGLRRAVQKIAPGEVAGHDDHFPFANVSQTDSSATPLAPSSW